MATQMKVETIKSEMIKPSSLTPYHLRRFKLSSLDQAAPFFRTLIILFYPNTKNLSIQEISQTLKKSLSETLTEFYPFAGRLRDNLYVECNDAGDELVFARVQSPASRFLEKPDSKTMLKLLVPPNNETSRDSVLSSPLMLVRVSFFDCGSASVSVRISHKIADGLSVTIFLHRWSQKAAPSMITGGVRSKSAPTFTPRFPGHDSLASAFREPPCLEDVSVKRLVIPGKVIEALKLKLAGLNPTRVEIVLSLIWKILIETGLMTFESVMIQHVNVRDMAVQSQSYVGNMASVYKLGWFPRTTTSLSDLVMSLKKGYREFRERCEIRVQSNGPSDLIKELAELKQADILCEPVKCFVVSSLCRCWFYELNLGFGNPSLVCIPNLTLKNRIFLMDSKNGGGIDVWLSLSKEDMIVFERSSEFLLFDSFIPSAM